MKTSLRIMGLLAVLVMLVGLLPGGAAAPASAAAGILMFNTVSFRTATSLIARTTEISFMATSPNGSNVMFVDSTKLAGTTGLKRSTSGGTSQISIGGYVVAAGGTVPAAMPFHYVAASPDDDNFWALVTNNRTQVVISIDNGMTWNNTNFVVPAGEIITGLAVSGQYQTTGGNARDIAVCTATLAGGAGGTILLLQLKPLGVGGWINQAAPSMSYRTVNFAPAYAGDYSLLAVGALSGATAAATATSTFAAGAVTGFVITAAGGGYLAAPAVTIAAPPAPVTATAGAVTVAGGVITAIALGVGGGYYDVAPAVTITDATGVGATATATIAAGAVTGFVVTAGGAGYSAAPVVTVAAPVHVTATATSTLGAGGVVAALTLVNGGNGYVAAPAVTIAPPTGVAGTYLNLGFRDINANTTTWNTSTNYPVEVAATAGASPNAATLVSASLALPADFAGQTDRSRRVYICYDAGIGFGFNNVFRVDNYRAYSLQSPEARPYALSYSGSFNAGKLLMTAVSAASTPAVGGSPSVPVWRTLNAQTAFPTWDLPYKAPTGAVGIGVNEARSTAVWSPDGKSALLGSMTSGVVALGATYTGAANPFAAGAADDETAVSKTTDDSDSWEQVSLIDTTITSIYDLMPSADNTKLYNSTTNAANNIVGIWRSSSGSGAQGFASWQRIGTFNGAGALTPLVRVAPDKEDGSVLFWGISGGGNNIVQRSVDGGKFWQNTLPGFAFVDFSAGDQNTLFLLRGDGVVRKGTSAGAGFTWGANIDARILGGNTIEAKGNNVVVGNTAAGGTFVAYSLDGATFSRIMYGTPVGGLRFATMDADFANNKTIYVVTNNAASQVYKWTIGTNTNQWTTLANAAVAPRTSIAAGPDAGNIYVGRDSLLAPPGLIDRSINATAGTIDRPLAAFDVLNVGAAGAAFDAPQRIRVAGKSPQVAIYAIENLAGPNIWGFVDTLTKTAPKIENPANNSTIPVAFNGFAQPFGIHWTNTITGSNQGVGPSEYQVQVGLNDDFSDVVAVAPANGVVVPAAFIPSNNSDPSVTVGANVLLGGTGYYVRVRVRAAGTGQAITSPYSSTVQFNVQAGNPVQAPSGGPQALAPQTTGAGTLPGFSWTSQSSQTTEYTFVLSEKADLSSPVVNTTTASTSFQITTALKEGTTYFWQVQATKPVPGPKSSVFSFTTSTKAPPPVTVQPQPTPQVTVVVPPTPAQGTPGWVWVVIGIGALLVIVTIVLIFRTRRV